MKIFDEYAAKFPLKPFSEEKEAEDERMAKAATDNQNEILRGRDLECSSMSSAHTSSEDSLLLSPVS